MDIGKERELYVENLKTGERFKIPVLDLKMHTESEDQWKHGGDCNKCRRKKYCGTPCKASGERNQALLHKAFAEAFMNVMKGK